MTMKSELEDDQAKEALTPAASGFDCEPDGPALERPKRRDWKRDPAGFAGNIRHRDDCDHKALRRTRFGVG